MGDRQSRRAGALGLERATNRAKVAELIGENYHGANSSQVDSFLVGIRQKLFSRLD
jgi:hypothetical protein